MGSHQPEEKTSNRLVEPFSLKLALVALVALLSAAVPQIFGLYAGAARAPQGVLFTVNTLDDHNDFVCDGTDCSLREAIQAANNAATDDTIDFSVTGTINLLSALPDITDSVTIEGPGADMLTVSRFDSDAVSFRIFDVTTTGTVSFSGLTISNGKTDGGGGGIRNLSTGTVNVINSMISDNDGGRALGGGISNNSTGTVNVTNSTISGNSVFRGGGGGISNDSTGTVNIVGSTINSNRSDDGGGGGVSNQSTGTVNITNSTISFNEADSGGGIRNFAGIIIVTETMISENKAGAGGGLANVTGTVNVINSMIRNHSARPFGGLINSGGAIFNSGSGTVTITGSTISDNKTSVGGGGIYNRTTGTVNVVNSTISGNDGGRSIGGGIHNESTGIVNVTNSTISGNSTVRGAGGGISNFDTGTVNVTNSTISGNGAFDGDGGGIYNKTTGSVKVKSSIIALNIGGFGSTPGQDVFGAFVSQGFNLIGKSDGSTGFTNGSNLDQVGSNAMPLDPLLELDDMAAPRLADNGGPTQTIALLCGSPAIDKGTSDGLTGDLTTDQRGAGFPRVVDDTIISNSSDGADIGAFELQETCNHPPVAQCKNVQLSANTNCQATVTAAQINNGSFDPDPMDSITLALNPSGPFGLGLNTVTLTVTDTYGASSSCTATVTVVDTTPPQITCPANVIIKTSNAGDPAVVVNYPPPSATDNCSTPNVVCSPPSGSLFPLGATTVTCTATDAATNAANCSFIVTVFDVCVQDDARRDTMLFNSQTGDYLYVRCGSGGLSLSGRGMVQVKGSLFTLEHSATDRRVVAKLDNSGKRGSASVQYFPQGMTFTITDRNTSDNTCVCP